MPRMMNLVVILFFLLGNGGLLDANPLPKAQGLYGEQYEVSKITTQNKEN